MITIDPQSPLSLSDQIVACIRNDIHSGRLQPSSHLPSPRELAAQLAVHLADVTHAYHVLETQGLIVSLRGQGTFVTNPHAATSNSPST